MKKPAPIKVSRRNHIRLIVVLLAATAVAVALSRRPFGSFRPAAPGKTIGQETRPKGAEKETVARRRLRTPSTTAKPGTETVSGAGTAGHRLLRVVIRNEADATRRCTIRPAGRPWVAYC
ncbi:MAG: hypothetical protein ACLT1W_11265 [Alistipes onderdonkii]